MSMEQTIRNEILDNYLFTDDQSELENSASLLEQGIIDSTGILELIYFLEEEFDIQVKDSELIPENLDSVDNILAYVKTKLAK